MRRRDLQQSGGGENYQAGRDILIQGVDAEQARVIAQGVLVDNLPLLQSIAGETARSRMLALTQEIVHGLLRRQPPLAEALSDPDVLQHLFVAQQGFAQSGEAELQQLLAELVVDRAAQPTRGLRALTLNAAIEVAPKLTEPQRRTIALLFVLRYMTPGTPPQLRRLRALP